jgi:hypothetical protein
MEMPLTGILQQGYRNSCAISRRGKSANVQVHNATLVRECSRFGRWSTDKKYRNVGSESGLYEAVQAGY